jgi:hypothetical protein
LVTLTGPFSRTPTESPSSVTPRTIASKCTSECTVAISAYLNAPSIYPYVRMDDDPLRSGGYTVSRGRPPYGELGREISFGDLPEGCKNLVLDMYQKMWNL